MSKAKPKAKTVEDLMKKTLFTKDAIECLLKMFKKYTSKNKKVDKSKFQDMLYAEFAFTHDLLMERIFTAFDSDGDGFIDEEEWVIGFNIYLANGIDEKKMKFAFRVYDLKNEGVFTRESMYYFLKDCFYKAVIEEDPDEAPKDLVEMMMKMMDKGKVQKVSYEDFESAVKKESLLLEFLGYFFPEKKYADKFCTLIGGGKNPWRI
ncbi:calaxin-like [Ylistrum balloti]|uniref:calaxin-like n=1 Tax=Ylistrum balloti TaxID=509963 RepID=UPI0029059708|nr:calaxin-like [Ylistrum balloti]